MTFFRSLVFSLMVALLLNGCGINMPSQTQQHFLSSQDPQWQQHLTKLKQIQAYQTQGQIGYISQKQRFSSRFSWYYQSPENYSLTLYSTLSSQTLTLRQQQNQLYAFDQTGKAYPPEQLKQLLDNTVGRHFPLHQLALWLKGQPNEKQVYKVGENHLLANFDYLLQQTQWSVNYLNYHSLALPLPKDILLKSPTHTVKIRIAEWQY